MNYETTDHARFPEPAEIRQVTHATIIELEPLDRAYKIPLDVLETSIETATTTTHNEGASKLVEGEFFVAEITIEDNTAEAIITLHDIEGVEIDLTEHREYLEKWVIEVCNE